MNTIINEESVLKQKYIRQGLAPAAAYDKAVAVLELVRELRDRCPDMTDAQRLYDAELEATAGEEALREMVERTNRPARLTVRRQANELYLERGQHWLLLSARETAALLNQIKTQLAAVRKAQNQARIHRRRMTEGRPSFRVVGGRLATNGQAA